MGTKTLNIFLLCPIFFQVKNDDGWLFFQMQLDNVSFNGYSRYSSYNRWRVHKSKHHKEIKEGSESCILLQLRFTSKLFLYYFIIQWNHVTLYCSCIGKVFKTMFAPYIVIYLIFYCWNLYTFIVIVYVVLCTKIVWCKCCHYWWYYFLGRIVRLLFDWLKIVFFVIYLLIKIISALLPVAEGSIYMYTFHLPCNE